MRAGKDEEGFVLVGLIVAIFLILLALSVAAPRVARGLRREREVEAIHRGNQYVRAVQLYYRKNGNYPTTVEQLDKANGARYLRQKYVDPMTGKSDWKLIHVGEAKTTVKGFFGKPLAGMNGSSLGNSVGGAPATTGTSGSPSGSSFGSSSFGSSSFGSSGTSTGPGSSFGSSSPSSPSTGPGTTTGSGTTGTTGSSTDSTGLNSQSATNIKGSGAPIMGVGTLASGNSITVLNEQKTYQTWEFIYDPRIEQLKAKASLLGGTSSGTSSGLGPSTMPGSNGTTQGSPGGSFGAGSSGTGSSGFGSSSFGTSSFGSGSSGSSNGSGTTSSPTPSSSPNPPQ